MVLLVEALSKGAKSHNKQTTQKNLVSTQMQKTQSAPLVTCSRSVQSRVFTAAALPPPDAAGPACHWFSVLLGMTRESHGASWLSALRCFLCASTAAHIRHNMPPLERRHGTQSYEREKKEGARKVGGAGGHFFFVCFGRRVNEGDGLLRRVALSRLRSAHLCVDGFCDE